MMRIVVSLIVSCLLLVAVGSSAFAGELFEEKPPRRLDTAPRAQLWREELRDEPIAPKQVRRSRDNPDEVNDNDNLDAEVEREIGADQDAENVAGD